MTDSDDELELSGDVPDFVMDPDSDPSEEGVPADFEEDPDGDDEASRKSEEEEDTVVDESDSDEPPRDEEEAGEEDSVQLPTGHTVAYEDKRIEITGELELDENGQPVRANRPPGGGRDLAAVAFGAGYRDGGAVGGRLQFGCPECGQIIAIEETSAEGAVQCPACKSQMQVPSAAADLKSDSANTGMRPAVLPAPKKKDAPASRRNLDADDVVEQIERDSQHRLNPNLQPAFQPFEPVEAGADEEARWRRTEQKYAGSKLFNRGAMAVLALAVVGVLGFAFFRIVKNRSKEAVPEEPKEMTEDERLLARGLEVLEKFGVTVEHDAKLAFIRHPEISEPRMQKYYSRNSVQGSLPLVKHGTGRLVTISGTPFIQYTAEKKGLPILVFLERHPTGELLIDWESMVGYSDSNWTVFLLSEPQGSHEFRVLATPDDYYNHSFSDSEVYTSLRLVDLENKGKLYGYVANGSRAEAATKEMFAGTEAGKGVTCRVKIRFAAPGKGLNQVFIEDIRKGWLEP